MIPVSDIIRRAATILNDEQHVRWTLTELIDWINDAAGEIIIIRPAANSVTDIIELKAGPYQTIPGRGIQLMDVIRNVSGRSISRTDRGLLDDQVPDWYQAKEADNIRHFTYDERNPKGFYVYPPAKEGSQVEVMYSALPELVTSETDTLDMAESYIGPIISYVLYRALAKDSEYADGQIAAAHWQAFQFALGERTQQQVVNSPKGAFDETP